MKRKTIKNPITFSQFLEDYIEEDTFEISKRMKKDAIVLTIGHYVPPDFVVKFNPNILDRDTASNETLMEKVIQRGKAPEKVLAAFSKSVQNILPKLKTNDIFFPILKHKGINFDSILHGKGVWEMTVCISPSALSFKKNGSVIIGYGETPAEAAMDFCKKISGRQVVKWDITGGFPEKIRNLPRVDFTGF